LALSNRITLPIKILTQGAQAVADGNLDVRIKLDSRDELGALAETFNKMIIHRSNSEKALKKSLDEKEVLLKEIHHRVKNNMAIVLSLLSMQARRVVGERNLRAFKDSRNRIMAMALIHEQLYHSKDLSNIRVEEYFLSLLDKLMGSFGVNPGSVKFDLDIQVETLNIDRLIPCGLIVNELVSNSFKYAFHETENGVVYISLISENGECVLTVGDNGSGLPEDFDVKKTDTLGLQIVDSLALQLGSSLEVKHGSGSRFVIRFKEKSSSSYL
jgi:two-component sensor histidine kinase